MNCTWHMQMKMIDLSMNFLSARKEVVAGVALGVIEQLSPGKSTHGPEQEVSGVAAEDPVVGPLGRLVPVAAPARVGHGVEEVVTGDPGRGTEGCRVDGLIAGEESGVGVAILAVAAGTYSTSHSLRCGDTEGHCHESEEAHGDFHVECEVFGECKDDDFLVGW